MVNTWNTKNNIAEGHSSAAPFVEHGNQFIVRYAVEGIGFKSSSVYNLNFF
jgi:hypothetical protein